MSKIMFDEFKKIQQSGERMNFADLVHWLDVMNQTAIDLPQDQKDELEYEDIRLGHEITLNQGYQALCNTPHSKYDSALDITANYLSLANDHDNTIFVDAFAKKADIKSEQVKELFTFLSTDLDQKVKPASILQRFKDEASLHSTNETTKSIAHARLTSLTKITPFGV